MPITAPKDWNQKGCAKPPQQLVAAVLEDDRLGDHRAEPRHPLAEPGRHAAAMQRQVGAARAAHHQDASARAGADASGMPSSDPNSGNPVPSPTGAPKFDTVTPTSRIPFCGGKTERMRSRLARRSCAC